MAFSAELSHGCRLVALSGRPSWAIDWSPPEREADIDRLRRVKRQLGAANQT